MNGEITQAFSRIRKKIDDHVDLTEIMAATALKDGFRECQEPESILTTIEELLAAKKRLQRFKAGVDQIETGLESLENGVLGIGDGCINARFNGLRTLTVELTNGMINQKMLTLTAAKQRGLIEDGERFRIQMPDGEEIETQLVQPGNRLQERGAFGRLYKRDQVEEGDQVQLIEKKTGEWELRIRSVKKMVEEMLLFVSKEGDHS